MVAAVRSWGAHSEWVEMATIVPGFCGASLEFLGAFAPSLHPSDGAGKYQLIYQPKYSKQEVKQESFVCVEILAAKVIEVVENNDSL